MPIYEYQCASCGALTDVKHGFKEQHTGPCAACGGRLVRRFTPAGIVFKGSGFYVNDSRKPPPETKPSDGKPEKAAAGETTSPAKGGSDGTASSPEKTPPPASTSAPPSAAKGDAAA